MLTRMADIRAAFQDPATYSSSAVVPDAPNPPYRWIPALGRTRRRPLMPELETVLGRPLRRWQIAN
jgi:hypothetical protein